MASPPPVILLVDDDVDFVEITSLALRAGGFDVVAAYDKREAMAKLAEQGGKVGLVITDLMMSSMDAGFSFARELKADPRYQHLPIILATSAASKAGLDFRPHKDAELAEMNIDAYFDKPVQAKALLEKVRSLLAKPA